MEKPSFVEGQLIEFDLNGIIHQGYIRGQSTTGMIYDFWIVEVLSPKIDKTTYPYSCIVIPHPWIIVKEM